MYLDNIYQIIVVTLYRQATSLFFNDQKNSQEVLNIKYSAYPNNDDKLLFFLFYYLFILNSNGEK